MHQSSTSHTFADNQSLWEECLAQLKHEVPEVQFNTWVRPLTPVDDQTAFVLSAPNRFIRDFVEDKYSHLINECLSTLSADPQPISVRVVTGEQGAVVTPTAPKVIASPSQKHETQHLKTNSQSANPVVQPVLPKVVVPAHQHNLVENYTFSSFVEGKSNQLALAAAQQVVESPGDAYNPLFLYGGVGLGKTHLMHAVGNALRQRKPDAKIVYLHSERFVADMVKALQLNAINDFKRFYRSVDAVNRRHSILCQ